MVSGVRPVAVAVSVPVGIFSVYTGVSRVGSLPAINTLTIYPVVASTTALHVITASKAFGATTTSNGSGQAGRGVNINSQSKGFVSSHLSSHSIKYS